MATKLREQVIAFHRRRFDQPVVEAAVPPDERLRFRLRLITEEMLEILDACGADASLMGVVRFTLDRIIRRVRSLDVDFPSFVDALGDTDYVIEGTRVEAGVDGEPIADEIQLANITKGEKGPDGKPVKPEGWRPPDIEGALKIQGWKP